MPTDSRTDAFITSEAGPDHHRPPQATSDQHSAPIRQAASALPWPHVDRRGQRDIRLLYAHGSKVGAARGFEDGPEPERSDLSPAGSTTRATRPLGVVACEATAPNPGATSAASEHGHVAGPPARRSSSQTTPVELVWPNEWPNGPTVDAHDEVHSTCDIGDPFGLRARALR